jgi:O-antigen/teichoic acid export membrane protein
MKRNLFKNYVFYILYQVFTILIPFIVVPYTTRTIGAEGLGINAFSSSIVQWFVIFGYMGISMYGNKEIARVRDDKAHLSKTFMGILSMQVCNMLLVIVLYFLFVVFAPLEYKNIYLIQGVSLFATVFDITWFFLGVEDFKKSSLRSIIFRLINVALIFMFVKSIDDLDIFVWINVVTAVLAQLVLFFQLKEYIVFKPVNIIESYKIHMKPNLVLFIPQIAISIYSVLDQTMTGLLADKTQLAFYQQAIRFDKMFLYFITSIGMVMLPRIANEHAKGDDNKINDYLNVTFKLALYLAIPMMFGMVGVGPFFIDWFMAPEFKIVGFLIAMMSPIILFIALSNVFGTQYLVPTNRLSQYSKSVIIGAIANFLFNLLLIPRFGAIGAGLSVMFAELCVTAVQYFYIRKSIKLNVEFKSIIIYFVSAILMCAVVYGIGLTFGPRILTNLLQVTVGFVIYMILLTIMKEPFHIKMLDQVLRLVKLKKN